jgi:acetolactate synthase regulatory subunit
VGAEVLAGAAQPAPRLVTRVLALLASRGFAHL